MLIIHAADIHLGASPDGRENWGKNRKQELWDSFERLIKTVKEQKADLLLIAGDLFHRPPLLRELREVNELFASLGSTKVVFMAGNHDFAGEHSCYHKFPWAENVNFLRCREVEKVALPEFNVEVYGLSYHQKEITERIYDKIVPDENDAYHILLAHGGDEKHIPFSKEKLLKSGFDYIAFGHIHKPGMIIPGKAVMAGSLEPTDHTCEGVHGYVRLKVQNGHNEIALIPFASREYRRLEIPVTPEDTMGSIYRRVSENIAKQGTMHIYEVCLLGKRHSSLEIMEEKLKSAGNIRKITDCTEKSYDYEMLKSVYAESLLERYIASFGECTTAVEKRALEIGTEVILEAMGV